jgi:chorismate mutase / prephenate dehydratase
MPSAQQPADLAVPADLASLRHQLDGLDEGIHDLIMRRAEVVEQIISSGAKAKGKVALRPGREAAIARRLLARHHGSFPRAGVVRVWRELICSMTAMQGPFLLAVCDIDPAGAYSAAAREHFGALVPLRAYRTPAQAIGEVSAGSAAAALLPLPSEGEPRSDAWWTALLYKDDPRIYVIARLPFWTIRPEGAPRVEALLVGSVPPDPSGVDRSLLGLEVAVDLSRARLGQALAAAGFDAGTTILRRDPGDPVAQVLVDVAGFVTDSDPRLASLMSAVLHPPIVLGAYAVPLEGDAK